MIERSLKVLYVSLGVIFLVIGLVGVFVPLLPTTPFVLLAAYLFSKGSPRLHAWLLSRPVVGPVIQDWQQSGVIRTRAKVAATIAIVGSFGGVVAFVRQPPMLAVLLVLTGAGLLLFVLTRPSVPAVIPKRSSAA